MNLILIIFDIIEGWLKNRRQVPSVSSSELLAVSQSLQPWTALTTLEPRISTLLLPWLLEVVSIDSHQDPLVTSSSAQLKRVTTKSERKFTQQSSSDKEDHGEDPTEPTFIAKTTQALLLTTREKQKVAL